MDLATMVINAATSLIGVFWKFLFIFGGTLGVLYMGISLVKMVRTTHFAAQQPVTLMNIIIVAILGALLVNLDTFINIMLETFGITGSDYGSLSYAESGDFGKFAEAINAVLTLATMAGGIFFIRGLIILKRATVDGSAQGADDVWRAATHMIGGALLVRNDLFIDAARTTFGLWW